MRAERLDDLLDRFEEFSVLVIGDVYLDEIRLGTMTGVSIEAPVPIIEIAERRHNPGAAGNVACNLAAMGARVSILGVVGHDTNAQDLRADFRDAGVDADGLVESDTAPTNTYGKIVASKGEDEWQEVLRTDTPRPEPLPTRMETRMLDAIDARTPASNAVVVIDQVGSVVTGAVLEDVTAAAKTHDLLTVGDSRERIDSFAGFDVAVPNAGELGQALRMRVDTENDFEAAGQALLRVCRSGLITCGSKGISGFAQDTRFVFPSLAKDVCDVTGAGDTVTAAATLALLAGGTLEEAAELANRAAAVAVGKEGVVTVTRDEIRRFDGR